MCLVQSLDIVFSFWQQEFHPERLLPEREYLPDEGVYVILVHAFKHCQTVQEAEVLGEYRVLDAVRYDSLESLQIK